MSKKMSIKDAAVALGVVEKTIQRRIESGKLKAEKVDGKWVVEVVIDTDQTPVKTPTTAFRTSEKPPSIEELQHLRSEVKHLRESLSRKDTQIDQLHKLLAKSTNQNDALLAKLPSPRQTLGQRLRPFLVQLRLTQPE